MDEGIDRQAGESGEAGSGQLDARAEKGEMPAPRRSSMHGRRGEAPAPQRLNVHGRRGSKPDSEQLKARSKAAFDEQVCLVK